MAKDRKPPTLADWEAVAASPVWTDILQPYLEDVLESQIRQLKTVSGPDQRAIVAGRIEMVMGLRDSPEDAIKILRVQDQEQKKLEEAERKAEDRRRREVKAFNS